ncbi:TlpA disulfide reductase family protein [Aidingimonas halophila]|uniref:Thiol-disulfide isomerase or thioredoxin n=1 Tax=Aidingimonas halophila TaxID=574349 RepID=A0A1H3HL69_9GAMM|nr:TlpA disulfide reductase family protein [Aidingimonas halophila]GHC37126.1 thiol:disulfide interchange protein [Aidingimonas halophila]SDY15548.1 Thiol-disulfide isomerase or thioredoxin [Aidingimonas halophila]
MDALALGPLLISLPRLYAFAVGLALLIASLLLLGLSKRAHARWFNPMLLFWLLGARLGHVATHSEAYQGAAMDILKLWQPGYSPVWGLVAALAWTAWYLRGQWLRFVTAASMLVAGTVLWLAIVAWAPLSDDLPIHQIPDITLATLEGESVNLRDLEDDRILVNLWATWCPPCLREMPLLEEVDTRDDVTVVIVNQGEDLLDASRYLDEQGLEFRYALLDPHQELTMLSQTPGLPTTMLFDSEGNTLEHHAGELSRSQLDAWLEDH